MMAAAKNFAADERHVFYHSCIVVVFTHGSYNALLGSDDRDVNIEAFVECFNADKAPGLQGKPKIFIFQACRGSL